MDGLSQPNPKAGGARVQFDAIVANGNGLADVATLLVGPSPDVLSSAQEQAGGPFDFVLVDGDHTALGVKRDLEGLLSVTTPGCLVLAHDTYNSGVGEGLGMALAQGGWLDAGVISTTCHAGTEGGQPVNYGGFRLLFREGVVPPSGRGLASFPRRIVRKLSAVVLSTSPGNWNAITFVLVVDMSFNLTPFRPPAN